MLDTKLSTWLACSMPKPKVISLFSGIMGLDLGLEATGFEVAVALEPNKMATETIKINRPDQVLLQKRIQDVTSADLLTAATLKIGEATVVTGGPCCQSFSTMGRRKSISDESRGGLFRHFLQVVRETQPRFFVMENVRGMLSAAVRHRPLDQRGPGFDPLHPEEELGSALKVICQELSELNYYVVFGLLNCADYGVPQTRMRVVFIGSRDGEQIRLPEPTHSVDGASGKPTWKTLRQALQNLKEEEPEFIAFRSIQTKFLRLLKAGQNWKNLPVDMQREALGAAADTWGGRSGFCRRLNWDAPCPTLTTAPDGRATMLCHPDELRPLSLRECARIQQFPDGWEFAGILSHAHIQLGNAVPLGLGEAIGKELVRVMQATKLPADPNNLGKVVCGDPLLAARLTKRPRTKLHPIWKRQFQSDLRTTREWMQKSAQLELSGVTQAISSSEHNDQRSLEAKKCSLNKVVHKKDASSSKQDNGDMNSPVLIF